MADAFLTAMENFERTQGNGYLVVALYTLATRIAALEATTSETGLMGRVIRRVEALEDTGNYGGTVIDHEKRLKALEADLSSLSVNNTKAEPAPAPAETVTISRADLVIQGPAVASVDSFEAPDGHTMYRTYLHLDTDLPVLNSAQFYLVTVSLLNATQ